MPHPGITERAFVLTPLAALEPNLTIPGRGTRTVLEHARAGRHHLPLWMGIANLTPDSFSDGGELATTDAVEAHAAQLAAAGAAFIDLGAESTRPGATPLSPDEEWARLEPALGRLVDRYRGELLRPRLSIDTYHVETARRALARGADLINDVSGLTTPADGRACGDERRGVRRHAQPRRAGRQNTYAAGERGSDRRRRALARGAPRPNGSARDSISTVSSSIPASASARTHCNRCDCCATSSAFSAYGLRVLVGHSRKSFMHHVTAASRAERDLFTVGASLRLCDRGVDILRVHDVAMHAAAYRGWSHAS